MILIEYIYISQKFLYFHRRHIRYYAADFIEYNALAKKENITLKELENYPIILMKEDSLQYQLVNQMFNKENINPDIVLTSNQLYIIKELLSNERNNYGAFIFKMLIKENDDIIGISLDKKIMLDVIICYKKGTNLSSKTKRFINFVKNNVSL